MKRLWMILFTLAALANIVGGWLGADGLADVAKCLLMPLLWAYLQTFPMESWKRRGMAWALGFSWLGDLFLLLEGEGNFLAGMGSFLLAQSGYLYLFYRGMGELKGWFYRRPWMALPLALYAVALYAYLFPALPFPLRLAMPLYAGALASVGLLAMHRRPATSRQSYRLCLWGALLFIASDSCIALSAFGGLAVASLLVMPTYIVAQLLLGVGLVRAPFVVPSMVSVSAKG